MKQPRSKTFSFLSCVLALFLAWPFLPAHISHAQSLELPPFQPETPQYIRDTVTKLATTTTVVNPYYFSLQQNPLVPNLGEMAEISVIQLGGTKSFSPSTSSFTWYLDGAPQPLKSGLGKSSFTFIPENQSQNVRVIIQTADGAQDTEERTINSLDPARDTGTLLQQKLQTLQQREAAFQKQAKAQGFGTLGKASLSVSNESPAPNETIDALFSSFTFDVNRTLIRWFVNGKKFDEGVGKKDINVVVGKIGETTTIRAVAYPENDDPTEAEISVTPFPISLYWWADTESPAWYKGKNLPTNNTPVHITAFLPTSLDAQRKYIYTWSIGENRQIGQSGYGKQTFTFTPNLPDFTETVSVTVENFEKTLKATRNINITPQNPEIRVCIIDLIAGCTKIAQAGTIQPGDSIDLRALLFFFPKTTAQNITYSWLVNDEAPQTKTKDRPWLLTIRTLSETIGTISTRLSASVGSLSSDAAIEINVK